ncbi:MAG: hypothetical protein AAF802_16790 [Planctomycetota bacterium]
MRSGIAVLDVVIAASLVMSLVAVSTPMVIRVSRIWIQTRHYHLAADLLSGEMDRVLAIDSGIRNSELESLTVPAEVANVLIGAELTGDIMDTSSGRVIVLSLDWPRLGDPPPMRLTAWINTDADGEGL